jgi:NADH dehydrogenase FAD-containing subunit
MKKLKEGGVVQVTQTTVKEITDAGLTIITPDKKEETVKADTLVLALLVPNREIEYAQYQTRDVYMIGDCIQVRRGYAAVHDGYTMGMEIDFLPYQTFHREKH